MISGKVDELLHLRIIQEILQQDETLSWGLTPDSVTVVFPAESVNHQMGRARKSVIKATLCYLKILLDFP